MGAIHVLDKSVYELIAAGEVIERPSSVIKELVENSIDAGAKKIIIELKSGGKVYLRITDNGSGMSKEDLPLAFLRHATSKISSEDDLNRIHTLGFRGEGLASICAVSKVEVMSKRKEDELGCRYEIEGGVQTAYEPAGCPDGTTIVVRDLFYNVPARQKFLKKDVTEANSIASIIQKLALSHPEISFNFIRDNRPVFVTPGDGKLLSAIYVLLGKEFHDNCIPIDNVYQGIRVSGYVTKPLFSKPSRALQTFFINSRYIKSNTFSFALEDSYKDKMMIGKFPGCVLNISVRSDFVDINSHPSKLEVKFQDEALVYNALYFSVKNSLSLLDAPEEIKASRDKAFHTTAFYSGTVYDAQDRQLTFNSPQAEIRSEGKKPSSAEIGGFMRDFIRPADVGKDFFGSKSTNPFKSEVEKPERPVGDYKYISQSSFEKKPVEAEKASEPQKPSEITVIGEAFKTYIVAQCKNDIILIDKHAAHERLIYESIKKSTGDLDMQLLVCRVNTNLSYEAYDALINNTEACRRIGLGIDFLNEPSVSVFGVPTIADNIDPIDLVVRLAECLIQGKKSGGMEIFDDLYHTMACKAAIKANSDTDKIELERLVQLVTADDLRYCPHGRPILVKLTKGEIEKMFRRIV